jgi:acyl-CoA dehydrogenase
MLARRIFSGEHEIFRAAVRRFIEAEMVPHHREWEKAGVVPRELWRKAGEQGLLCANVAEAYGGGGADWLFNVVVVEELARAGVSGPGSGFMVHSEMVASYLVSFASEETKRRYLPKMVSGEMIGAIAMTEPGAGSDLKSLRTTARRSMTAMSSMARRSTFPTAITPTSSSWLRRPIPTRAPEASR